MATSADYANWLRNNQNKRGTPNYATVLRAYQEAALEESQAAQAAPTAAPIPALRTGIGAALGKGFEDYIGSTTTGLQSATGDANSAAELALKRAAASPYADQVSWDKVKEVYAKEGAVAAALEVARQVPLAIAEQLPQLGASAAATYAGAKLGALTSPVTGPVGPIVGGGLGFLASALPSALGSNVERQAAVQREAGQPIDINMGAAVPAALAQTGLEAAGTFIPLGRRLVGKLFGAEVDALLRQGKKEAAETLARESLVKVLTKGTAVGVAAEVPTEVLQQAIERGQAGLSVLDDDALKEYGQTVYQTVLFAGPMGATARTVSRGGARDEIRAAEETTAAEKRKAEREAEEAKKKSPEYLLDLEARYKAAVAKKAELDAAAAKKPPAGADPAAMIAYRDAVRERDAFAKKEMAEVSREYVTREKEIAALKEQQRLAGITPQDAFLEQLGIPEVKVTPTAAPSSMEEAALEAAKQPAFSRLETYAKERMALADEQSFGMAEPKDYAEYLMGSIPTARLLVKENQQLPGFGKRKSNEIIKLVKERLENYDKAQAAKRQGSPIAQLEAEEAAALEDTARAEEARLAETEERKRLAPEITALQRMAARRLPDEKAILAGIRTALQNPNLTKEQRETLIGAEGRVSEAMARIEARQEDPYLQTVIERAARAAPAPAPQPSAAIGQMQQLLTGQDVTYTAEEPKERQLRRVPGEGFKLFGESRSAAEAAPAKTPDTKLLRERINRALLNPDLSDAAYDLLRRAESLLPDVEMRLETLRTVQDPTRGTQQDIAQTAGLLELLDKQLKQIEIGTAQPRKRPKGMSDEAYAAYAYAGAERRREGLPMAGRTLEQQRRPIAPGAANIVEPTFGTQDDIKLARQRSYAELVSQGFSPGEAAKRAFQIGKPTREAQEVPTDRFATPVLPPERGSQTDVTRRFAAPVTPMQPREARQMAPGPEAERQPGRFLAQPPRKGTIRAQGAPLSLASEIEPLLDALERARAEDAGQQVLFPELEKERGTIASTPEAFRRRLERLKAVKDGYARELLRKEAAIEPLEQEIAQLEETLVVYQQQQKAFENAQFILNNNAALLKELRMTGAGTDALRGGMGALTLSEKNLKQVADAFARQRTLINAYLERVEREKAEAPKLKASDFNEIGQLLATQANDEARAKQALEFVQEELTRITRAEEDIYNRQFPQLDQAKETARAGMRDLHKRYGEASEWLNGLKELRVKIQRQQAVASESQKQRTSNPELSQLVADLGRQLEAIDGRIARNKALMGRLETQIAVAVAESKIATLKANASPEAIKRASDDLVAAKQRLRTLRAEVFKGQAKEVEAAAEPQADEATDYAENLKTHQRMLEAMQLRTESGTIVPALSYAQRLAREAGTAANVKTKFSVDDLALLDKDPKRVLNGLVSRATDLENKIKQAVARSRGAEFRSEKDLINRYSNLLYEYENAETALERSQLEPELSIALREYNDALNKTLNQRVVWKGQARDTAELLNTYQKIAYLEERFFLPQAAEKRTYGPETPEESAAREREAAAIFESQREAQAGAGETTGEALTRSQAAKRRKPQKTVYSGKGVSPEELSKKDAEDLLVAEGKQANGQPLTARERKLLSQQRKADERIAENTRIKEEAAKNALVRAAFEKKERKEQLTALEQFLYDEAVSAGAKTAEDIDAISLEEAAATETKPSRGARTTEEAVDEKTRTELEETFAARAGFEDVELSRGATANPSTTDSVRTELKPHFPDLGRVQLYDSVEALVKANPQYEGRIPDDARGFVDRAGNKAFLIAGNINQGQALSVLLHEVGAHIGMKNLLGDAQYNAFVNAVERWQKAPATSAEGRVARAAQARVEAAETPESQQRDELLAYAVEEAVNAGITPQTKSPLGQWLGRIVQRMEAAVRRFFGMEPKGISLRDLVNTAYGAAKVEMQPATPQMSRRTFLRGASAAVGAMKLPPLSKEMNLQALRSVFDGSFDARDAWFGALNTATKNRGIKSLMGEFEDLYEGDNALVNFTRSKELQSFLYNLNYDENYEGDGYDYYLNEMLSGKDGVKVVADLQQALQAQGKALVDAVKKYGEERGALPEVGELFFSKNLPTASRVASNLVGEQKGFVDKLRDNFLGMGFRTQYIDKLFPTEEALKRGGVSDKDAMQAMYYLRMHDQRMHLTSQAATVGVPERVEKTRRDGTKEFLIEAKDGANLKQAFDILKRKDVVKEAGSADAANKLVTLYMAAIRGERVGYDTLNFGRAWASAEIARIEGELKSPKLSAEQRTNLTKRKDRLSKRLDSMPSPADIKAAKAEIDANPVLREAFNEVRDIYNQYNRDLLNFNVQTGAISRELANKLLQESDYIPYYRVRDGVAELLIGKETPIRIGNLKDSPHLQELVGGDEPVMDFITSSIQNTSMLIDMATHNLAMRNLMFEFRDVGLATIGKTKGGKAPEGAVTFKVDGVEHYGVVDTEMLGISSDLLVKGLAGIPTMFPTMIRVMGMPARFLRRLIVASPVYMARQLFRDSLGASIASGANTVPLLSALKQIGKTDVLEKRGITGGQVFTGMPEDMSRMIKDMQAGKISFNNGLAWLESKAAQADALTRRSQYESYLQQGLSEMEATYMALESMNFSRRGLSPSIHMASALIPFFNTQIQGLDVLYRSFRGKMPMNERLNVRRKLLVRGAMLFGLSFAYALAMQDDEAYKNAKPEDKYGNWFVPLDMFGIKEPLRLPIPFELGYIFKALPEAIVNIALNEKGAEEAQKALKHIGQQIVPGLSNYFIPQAVKPALEVAFGSSIYTGRDIEPAREQGVEPGYRTQSSTTELAKAVGEMTGFSPIKLEFLIRGYTGQMGMAAIAALSAPFAGAGEGPAPATKRYSDLPLIGTLFQPKDASGIVDLVYERMNKVRQAQETYERFISEGKQEKAAQYAKEKADELSLASVAGAFRQQMGEITDYERRVRASNLSPERKREELDRATQAKITLSKTVQAMSGRRIPQAAPA